MIYKVSTTVYDTNLAYVEYSPYSLTWSMKYVDRFQWLRTIQSLAVL